MLSVTWQAIYSEGFSDSKYFNFYKILQNIIWSQQIGASKLVPVFFLGNEQNVFEGGFITFQSVLLWRYYNGKKPTG